MYDTTQIDTISKGTNNRKEVGNLPTSLYYHPNEATITNRNSERERKREEKRKKKMMIRVKHITANATHHLVHSIPSIHNVLSFQGI